MDRKKLNEILDKHVQKFFKKAPTARFDDVPSETFIDAMEEAINYTRCCTEVCESCKQPKEAEAEKYCHYCNSIESI